MHTDRNANQLAGIAECASPDRPDSPGADFLLRIAADCRDHVEWLAEHPEDDDRDADDAAHAIADGAVPIYTYVLWQTFTDLAAWEAFEDYRDEMGSSEVSNDHGDGMTAQAAVALYWIGHRLAVVLLDETPEADDDADDDGPDDAGAGYTGDAFGRG